MPDFPYTRNRDWVNEEDGATTEDPAADDTWFEAVEAAIHQGQDHEKEEGYVHGGSLIVPCLSTERPANPPTNLHIFETDTDLRFYNAGTPEAPDWRAWGGSSAGGGGDETASQPFGLFGVDAGSPTVDYSAGASKVPFAAPRRDPEGWLDGASGEFSFPAGFYEMRLRFSALLNPAPAANTNFFPVLENFTTGAAAVNLPISVAASNNGLYANAGGIFEITDPIETYLIQLYSSYGGVASFTPSPDASALEIKKLA